VDHMCHSLSFVAAGIGQWLHAGWSHSRPAGHRRHCGRGPIDPGPKMIVRSLTLAGKGEVFGKGEQARYYFSKLYDLFSSKSLAMNQFNTN